MKPNPNFIIEHSLKEGKNILTFTPSKPVPGYAPKEIEITPEQWDQLRFHFMNGIDDKTEVVRLFSI